MASCCPFIYPGRAGHNITSEPDKKISMVASFSHRRFGQLRLRYQILAALRKPNSCISQPRATKTTKESRSRASSIPYLCLVQCCSLQCLSVLVHTDNEIRNDSRIFVTLGRCVYGRNRDRFADCDRIPAKQQLCSPQFVWMPPIYMRSKVGSCIVRGSWICSEPPVRGETGACCPLTGCDDQIMSYFRSLKRITPLRGCLAHLQCTYERMSFRYYVIPCVEQ